MKAFIIEDEIANRAILKGLLMEFCPGVEIVGEAVTIEEAVPKLRALKPMLVFLDIHLPKANGFTLYNHFETLPFKVIFTTAYQDYAIQALRLSAIDFLLKPIDVDELIAAVLKVSEIKELPNAEHWKSLNDNIKGTDSKLAISTIHGFSFVKIDEIIRCIADGKYTTFYLTNGTKITSSKNIGEFEQQLIPFNFFRTHRSEVINLSRIKEYRKGKSPRIIMEDESVVQVAQSRKAKLLERLGH